MKAEQIKTLEKFFKTDNEYWNGYTFEMLCEVIAQGNFENPEIPLQLFDKAIAIFLEQHQTPLSALQELESAMQKENLNEAQTLFVYDWVYKYVNRSDFDEIDLSEIKDLLKSHTDRLTKKPEYNKPLTSNIRDTLKELMQKELEQLPETLKSLEPVQRLNVLCKLMPYVLPKTESVQHNFGEPEQPQKGWFD